MRANVKTARTPSWHCTSVAPTIHRFTRRWFMEDPLVVDGPQLFPLQQSDRWRGGLQHLPC
ncbi:unnamed protein product [Ixodes pacificus]